MSVDFEDKSISAISISSWLWDFGDGATSDIQNPTHTYASAGTYTVKLTVKDLFGIQQETFKQVYVTSEDVSSITPDFEFTVNNLVVTFADKSVATNTEITSWSWNFGDGATSDVKTPPAHTYALAGTYTVVLTIKDKNGVGANKSHEVTVTEAPIPPTPTVTADFTYVKNDLEVTFTDTSVPTGTTIKSWLWEFGDTAGTTSIEQNPPAHTYALAGTYTVKLTVTDANGVPYNKSHEVTVTEAPIPPTPKVTADFTYVAKDLEVTFTDTSIASSQDTTITTWLWEFGDTAGTTSADKDATHTYTSEGEYTVNLTVTDGNGVEGNISKPVRVTAPAPTPKVTADFTYVAKDLEVTFTDTSIASSQDTTITKWSWNFGDSSPVSIEQNPPPHIYSTEGHYTVNLTVTDGNGATDTKSESITVTAPAPTPTVTADFTYVKNDLEVTFTDTSVPTGTTIKSWLWEFGDTAGTTSIEQNPPPHTYSTAGTYTVKLTVTDANGVPYNKSDEVTVTEAPTPKVTADFTYVKNDLEVTFTDTSVPTGTTIKSWLWEFGDTAGTTSIEQNPPPHTYSTAGTYTVKLTVTDANGVPYNKSDEVTVTEAP